MVQEWVRRQRAILDGDPDAEFLTVRAYDIIASVAYHMKAASMWGTDPYDDELPVLGIPPPDEYFDELVESAIVETALPAAPPEFASDGPISPPPEFSRQDSESALPPPDEYDDDGDEPAEFVSFIAKLQAKRVGSNRHVVMDSELAADSEI